MSELFKDIYNREFYVAFSAICGEVVEGFDEVAFVDEIYDCDFDQLELKERMYRTSEVMHGFLSVDFAQAAEQIIAIIDCLKARGVNEKSVEYMFLPHFIEQYGLDDFAVSITAFECITQFTSCEFAVRPFLIRYPDKMLAQMIVWSQHQHASVRRLASEGARPRLPWAMALPSFKDDPAPLLPILENLRNDSCEVVRRSVANNLNDISKDNKDFVIDYASNHLGESQATDKLIKHACRTLLKQGEPQILSLYGLSSEDLSVEDLVLECDAVHVGDSLKFDFVLKNLAQSTRKVRIEYAIHYLKKNGSLSPKVFKISERDLAANQHLSISRAQSFKLISTRVYHVGGHRLSIIVNGKCFANHDFELTSK